METNQRLLEAIQCQEPVAGFTHGFYRYPARFSPLFAREAIKAFSKPGDVVLDPFMGGGTTVVEAQALGRRGVGADINSLALFVTKAKTTILSKSELRQLREWAHSIVGALNLRNSSIRATEWLQLGYQRNICGRSTWPIRKTVELALAKVSVLASEGQRTLARCALLRTAQWALDCRTDIPPAIVVRQQFISFLEEMVAGATEYAAATRASHKRQRGSDLEPLCLHRSVIGIETENSIRKLPAPALILTSPPYPGVHVLYHRWQIRGRRETPAPFWIAGTLDGSGAAYYTFGDRSVQNLKSFFNQMGTAFRSLAKIANFRTTTVQMVAFSDPSWQLPQYLAVMKVAGFEEFTMPGLANWSDGRIWRSVPNRKWYATQRGAIDASNEVVLFHRKSRRVTGL